MNLGVACRTRFTVSSGSSRRVPRISAPACAASVLIHLPGLVLTKEIGKVLAGLQQMGLTYRGLYGEGSEVVGNFFQISNQTTLGRSEEELVDHLLRRRASRHRTRSRKRGVYCVRDAGYIIEDKLWRAYGTLRYARSLTFDEAMNYLSGVRLAVGSETDAGPQCIHAQQAPDLQSASAPCLRGRARADGKRSQRGASTVSCGRRLDRRGGSESADGSETAFEGL